MDENIRRGIELGVAFLIFVSGLGLFFNYQQQMVSFLYEARGYELSNHRFDEVSTTGSSVASAIAETTIQKDTLYSVLTNDNDMVVYVNGIKMTKLRDMDNGYEGLIAIKQSLTGLSSSTFEVTYVVDEYGDVVATYYTGI